MFTYETVKKELAEIAYANPFHVYESPITSATGQACLYFHDDEPGCIVGHWFAKHGVTAELVNTHRVNGVTAVRAASVLGIELDKNACRLLANTQSYQDNGMKWELAFARAVEDVEG